MLSFLSDDNDLKMEYIYQLIELVKRLSSYFGLADNRQNVEDVFYQFLYNKNYDEALKLAQQHKYLDVDVVYKCRWRSSGITVQSINSVLGSIKDKLWAINECARTVPISYEACSTLIEFGLHEANLRLLYELGSEPATTNTDSSRSSDKDNYDKHGGKLGPRHGDSAKKKRPPLPDNYSDEEIEELIDFENLTDQQKELCRCRQDLLRHQHSLLAYENILGDYRTVQQHFDHVFYDEFRQKCPLNVCLDFAHDADSHAVGILLNFYTDILEPHLLAILSNLPETQSPYQYRDLLPCVDNGQVVHLWKQTQQQTSYPPRDWSNRAKLSSSFVESLKEADESFESEFYKEYDYLAKFRKPLTPSLLTGWFKERALEMETRTLLLTNAIQLLHLGSELNVELLRETHDDLLEFDRIIYDCCTENNIHLSYEEFNRMDEVERLALMTGDSIKNCRDRFRFYVLPYIQRRDTRLGLEGKANLLREYFRKLAHTREHICRAIHEDLLDKIESDPFVANWTKDLDDVIDEIGLEIKTIERTRQAKQLSDLASKTMALGELNSCYEACKLIMMKDHKDCWPLCCQLGMHKQFKDTEAKYKLLAFALAHCDDVDGKMTAKILENVVELRKRDEKIQFAYIQKNLQ